MPSRCDSYECMCDECDTTHMSFYMPSRSNVNMNELNLMQMLTPVASRRHSMIPPQMLNPAQFGNLIT